MTDSDIRIAPGGVVVGVDGSPNASLAAAWAANEALLREESLTLVHALSVPNANAVKPSADVVHARDRGRDLLDGTVEAVHERFPDLPVDTLISDASPGAALHELSRHSALVVTGTRGHGGFPGMALGSVSRRLSAHTRCPLVVVPAEMTPEKPFADVVVGIEPHQAAAPITYAFDAAERYHAQLNAVRAWWPPKMHLPTADASRARLAESHSGQTQDLEALLEAFRSSYPKVDLGVMAWRGNAVPILTEAADGSRLLVVGAHRHRGPLAVGAGYVVDGVLAHSRTPVAVVPIR